MGIRAQIGAAALVAGLSAGVAAARAPKPLPSLTMTPSVLDVVVSPGTPLTPISVVNGTPVTFKVRFYTALVHQELDGSLVIRERRRELAAAQRLFRITPTKLVLAPRQSTVLHPRFLRPEGRRRAAYAAAVVEAVPSLARRQGPTVRIRLLGALLVRMPGAPAPRGRMVGVRVAQLGRRLVAFCGRVANTGRVHGYAEDLRLTVRHRGGGVVLVTSLRRGVVLPRYRRDFGTKLFRLLPRGRYVLSVRGRFGTRTIRAAGTFTLVAPNRLGGKRSAGLGCAVR